MKKLLASLLYTPEGEAKVVIFEQGKYETPIVLLDKFKAQLLLSDIECCLDLDKDR